MKVVNLKFNQRLAATKGGQRSQGTLLLAKGRTYRSPAGLVSAGVKVNGPALSSGVKVNQIDEVALGKGHSEVRECLNAFARAACFLLSITISVEEKTYKHWESLVDAMGGRWDKVAKYKIAAFIAYHYKQPLPKKPFDAKDCPGRMFSGELHRKFDNAVRHRTFPVGSAKHVEWNDRRMSYLRTFESAKVNCPRADDEFVDCEVESTIVSLTDDKKEAGEIGPREFFPWDDSEPAPLEAGKKWGCRKLDWNEARRSIRSVVKEVFPKNILREHPDLLKPFFPSTRACLQRAMKWGGTAGHFGETYVLGRRARQGGWLGEMKSALAETTEEFGRVSLNYLNERSKFELRMEFANAIMENVEDATRNKSVLIPIGLAEPLKIRVITKGPAEVYMSLANVQKILAAKLEVHPTFVLTGKQVDVDIVRERMGVLPEGKEFLSGDYSAATNNLKSNFSAIYVEELVAHTGLPSRFARLLMKGMVGNYIGDPHKMTPLKQTGGQPMGFINSFVGLCICNAALAKLVHCYDNGGLATIEQVRLANVPMLINGDDLLMHASKAGFKFWEQVGSFCGLSSSIGKTFHTDKFAQINSRNYIYENGSFRKTYYTNMGLLEGTSKGGVDISTLGRAQKISQLASNYRQLMKDCDTMAQKAKVHRKFNELHKDVLTSVQGIARNAPTWCGGLGFTGYIIPSERDRRAMHYIRLNYSKLKPKSLPMGEKLWCIHDIAKSRIKGEVKVTKDLSCPGIKELESATNWHSINMLFDDDFLVAKWKDMEKHSAYEGVDVSKKTPLIGKTIKEKCLDKFGGAAKAKREPEKFNELVQREMLALQSNLKHNERLWQKVLAKRVLPEPLRPEECLEGVFKETLGSAVVYPYSDDVLEVVVPEPTTSDECPPGYLLRQD